MLRFGTNCVHRMFGMQVIFVGAVRKLNVFRFGLCVCMSVCVCVRVCISNRCYVIGRLWFSSVI